MNEWISVEDKMPDVDEPVLIYYEGLYVGCASHWKAKSHFYWNFNCDCYSGSGPQCVTHWMPLPKPPKE